MKSLFAGLGLTLLITLGLACRSATDGGPTETVAEIGEKAASAVASAVDNATTDTQATSETPAASSQATTPTRTAPALRLEEEDHGLLSTHVVRHLWGEGRWLRKPDRDDEIAWSTGEVPNDWRGNVGVRYKILSDNVDDGTSVTLTQRLTIDLADGDDTWNGVWRRDVTAAVGRLQVMAWRFDEHQPHLPGTFTFEVLNGEEKLLERALTVLPRLRGDDSGDILETTLPSGLTFRIREYGLFSAKPEFAVRSKESSYGGVMMLDDLRHVGTTAEVPLARVDYFGYFFEVEGWPEDTTEDSSEDTPKEPSAEDLLYTVRIVHPEWYNKFRDERSTLAHWKLHILNNTGMALERLLLPYMKVPGEYHFEIEYKDRIVLRKRFDVYDKAPGAG